MDGSHRLADSCTAFSGVWLRRVFVRSQENPQRAKLGLEEYDYLKTISGAMNVQKFRISNRGRLSGLLYISDNNPGKIASLLPIASSGAWPAQIDFEVKELIHQQFAAGTSPETIAIQLLERAGLDCGEIVVTPM